MIIVDARTWRDKVNGNTYHKVKAYLDGEFVGESRITYGYGNHFKQTGHAILVAAGILSNTYHEFMREVMNNPKDYHFTCTPVSRKKDLTWWSP